MGIATDDIGAEAQSLRQVFAALGDELERIRLQAQHLEAAVAELVARYGFDEHMAGALQRFDATLQHVTALRDFMSKLSLATETAAEVRTQEALAGVTLAAVRDRLAGFLVEVGDGPWEAV